MLYLALICNAIVIATLGTFWYFGAGSALNVFAYIALNMALAGGYATLAVAVIRHRKEIEARAMMLLMIIYNSFAALKVFQLTMY